MASIGIRHDHCRALAPLWTDGAEDVCVVKVLVHGRARHCSFLRSLIGQPVFLADAGIILKQDFNGRICWEQLTFQRSANFGFEVFLKATVASTIWPGWRGLALTRANPSEAKAAPP